ncbi:MAG: DUF2711 family protein [Opitutaceae bacterium]
MKKKKILPEPDRYSVCPQGDERLLDFYKGHFKAVYILLHPFINPVKISKDRFCPDTYPTKKEIIKKTKRVSWQEIIENSELNSFSEVDIGLRTGILGLGKPLASQNFVDEINRIYDDLGIVCPSEGEVAELLQDDLLRSIQSCGYDWVWIGDEFGTERKLNWIESLFHEDFLPPHGTILTPGYKILITTHWDSHFSLLCSSRDTIDQILKENPYEGFYCNDETQIYWSTQNKPDIPIGI